MKINKSMTKKLIALGATAAVIVLLAVTLNMLNNEEPQPESIYEPVEVIYVLGEATPQKAVEIRVSNENGGYTLLVESTEEEYRTLKVHTLVGYEDFPIADSIATHISTNSDKLIAKSLVAQAGADFAAFGLDKPTATLDIIREDGSASKMIVGSQAPGNEGHYATNETGAVYLVATGNISNLFIGPLGFMNRVITAGGGDEMASFKTATLGGAIRPEPIVIREASVEETTFSSHKIISPFSVDLDLTFGFPDIITVYGITATEVVDTEDNLGKYGLDEPYSTIEIVPSEEMEMSAFTLSATEPDEDGFVYMHSSQYPLIYKVSAASLGWLERTAHDMMGKLAILPHIDTLSRVTVDAISKKYVFELAEDEDEKLVVTYEGNELVTQDFRKYYQTLMAASFDSVAEEPLPENPKLLLRYTYEYIESGKAPDVVSFYEGPARRAYIVLNDGPPFYVLTTYMDRVLVDAEKLIAGEPVLSYL